MKKLLLFLLWFVLTGKLVFQGETMVKVGHKIGHQLPNSNFCDYCG